MTIAELKRRLSEYPDDHGVFIVNDERVCEIQAVEEWKHFQTDESMDAVLLEPGGLV